ncbi:MAG TPA: 16S rRNA (guanine(527)-N(7))-methyltransferase RsmG [Solirubrobacterales bacterium]|nr:16S rRNA (guanine(527)-N(7))-methyltransferase RsmG [Solirubrobacterales bacterium]
MTAGSPADDPALEVLMELLATEEAPVSRASVRRARDVHIADALSGLEVEPLRTAARIADLGSGAGLPGLVLAARLPAARVDLIESVRRKCDFLRTAIERMGLRNADVVCERSETWAGGEGREAYDAVTVRAVGSLATLAELASPLLRDGGVLVAWKGARSRREEDDLRRAAPALAMEPLEVRATTPYPGSRDRHIHLLRKNGPTPNGLPRRPGMAAKRPFGPERNGTERTSNG